ncbi:hypothetical protein [Streptomyces sp. NPDC012510]|uniref:hypothetical protein n=1 Tax=Streptomyces sp. NPDC012510 TaxID=3364838 RepID=UPI0036E05687
MPHQSHTPETRTRHSDPRSARGSEPGRPGPPRGHRGRRGPAWALLAVSMAMLVTGVVLPQGLLLASGLVTAGMAAHLLAPPPDPDHPGVPLPEVTPAGGGHPRGAPHGA